MDNFKIIYKILKILEKSMNLEEFNSEQLSAEAFGLDLPYWSRIMTLLVNEGYVTGIYSTMYINSTYPQVRLVRPEITIKGLTYLSENSLMKKAAEAAKGIVDIIK